MKKETQWKKDSPSRSGTATSTGLISLVKKRKQAAGLLDLARQRREEKASVSRSAGPKWLRVGLRVRLRWSYDVAYGDGKGEFKGKVVKLDDWITVVSSAGVKCHMPLYMCEVSRVESSRSR